MIPAGEELDHLERVFLRVGAADSDEQLESVISKFLIPILLQLSISNEGVRQKVIELLTHINKRVRRQPAVQLPVEALLAQFRDPRANSFLINFSLLYIKLGFPRLPPDKKLELAPVLLWATDGKPKSQQDSLLLLLTTVIGNLKLPLNAEDGKQLFKMADKPELMKQFLSFMLDMLLLPYGYVSSGSEESTSSAESTPAPPGMSRSGFSRVTSSDIPMTPENLEQIKLGIVKFLASNIFSPNEVICHLIIATADTQCTVADLGEAQLKKISGSVDWSNVEVANSLFQLYLGYPGSPEGEPPPGEEKIIPPADRVTPSDVRIRLKILPYLSHFEKGAILSEPCVQVIFNTLQDENSNAKLKLQALSFARAIVNRSDIETLDNMSEVLYTGLLNLVWDRNESDQLRVPGYMVIGHIVKRLPHLINRNITQLQTFFEKMSSDTRTVRGAVRDSLLIMIDAFKSVGKQQTDDSSDFRFFMLTLLSSEIESPEPMARFVAVKYTAAIFEPSHSPSRYLLLLATGDIDSDVNAVALQSIYSFFERENLREKIILPSFREMTMYVYNKAMDRMKNVHQRVTINRHDLPFNDVTFKEVLVFLRLCLAKSVGVNVRNRNLIIHPCQHSPAFRRYILNVHKTEEEIFNNYLSLVEMFLRAFTTPIPLTCFIEVIGTCPEVFAPRYREKFLWLKNYVTHAREDIRDRASLLMALVSVNTMNEDELNDLVSELVRMLEKKTLEDQHGAAMSLGFITEYRIMKMIEEGRDVQEAIKSWDFMEMVITRLAKLTENFYTALVHAGCVAIGQIAKVMPLPLPAESQDGMSKRKVMNSLVMVMNSPKATGKTIDAAVRACGLLCLGEQFPFSKELIREFLCSGKQTRDIEVHFSMGEALVLCIEGLSSREKRNMWKKDKGQCVPPPVHKDNLRLMCWMIEELEELMFYPHRCSRQAVCVFLLTIVRRLYYLTMVRERFLIIQAVFLESLTETNEFVQDLASKGLSLLYEFSGEENRKKVLADLIDQLLFGKKPVPKFVESTSFFEPPLTVSPSGLANLAVYKELCSLASDMKHPELVYKFMNLANHGPLWTSKKGAAFGFQTVAIHAADYLLRYIPKLIPRLYRYQYDQAPKVKQAMSNIWHSIVKNTQKALDEYLLQIIDNLILHLSSTQFRVRLSCCLAVSDLFKGNRSLLSAKPKLPELWKALFRVMNDTHEGTRASGRTTCIYLASQHVKLCDQKAGEIDQEMLQISLNVFLSQVTNSASEIKEFCLNTLSELVNAAGGSLKPNLTTLIPSLLESSGKFESISSYYLSSDRGTQELAQEVIDIVQANLNKSQCTSDAIAKCVQQVDVEMLDVLVPKIIELMKSMSLGCRAACANIIVLLTRHLGDAMEQYTGKLLAALVSGVLDSTVQRTFAATIGQIIHTAKPSSVEKLLKKLSNWYFEKEDPSTRKATGHTLQAIAQYNGEILRDHSTITVPLIFFAMHEKKVEGEINGVMWEDIWNEVTSASASESRISHSLNEMCELLDTALNSSSWTMKAQGARCIVTIATRISDIIEDRHRDFLIQLLLSALQGKTFLGKEDLLKALSTLTFRCAESLKENPTQCQEVVEAVLKECGKRELSYKRHGVEALGIVLEAFDNFDYFEKVYGIVQKLFKQLDEDLEKGETPEEITKIRNEKFKTIEVMYTTLGKSWPKKKETQLKFQDVILNEFHRALETSPRDVQVAVLSAFRYYVEKLHYFSEECEKTEEDKEALKVILEKTTRALLYALGIQKHGRLRKEALNIVYALGNKLDTTGRKEELDEFLGALRCTLQELEKDQTPEVRTRLMDLKQLFKN